jgi:hypothetical protein
VGILHFAESVGQRFFPIVCSALSAGQK